MKNIITCVLIVLLWMSTFAFGVGGVLPGSGTVSDPYLIEDLADFDVFADEANAGTYWASGVYAKLVCDIDLNGRVYDRAVIAWDTDDTNGVNFDGADYSGIFEGNNHIISNISLETYYYAGLFGRLNNGSILNLGVENINITSSNGYSEYVGGLVSCSISSLINNCYTIATIETGGSMVGGLAGCNGYGSTIEKCYSNATVSGYQLIGGLVGLNKSSGTINESYAIGYISGSRLVGGLAGRNYGGSIYWSNASSTVSCDNEMVGGLAGGSSTGSIISNCYSTGTITGDAYKAGGLIGDLEYGQLLSCYSHCSVSGSNSVGGLIGSAKVLDVEYCYSTGVVSGSRYPGGFMGYLYSGSSGIKSCFWDVDSSGMTNGFSSYNIGTISELQGLNTGEMQTRSTFTDAGWDFIDESSNGTDDFWSMKLYPILSINTDGFISIPDITSLPQIDAEALIISSGFVPGNISYDYNSIIPEGNVISQFPLAGKMRVSGAYINYTLSLGVYPITGLGTKESPYIISDFEGFNIFCDPENAVKYWEEGVYTRLDNDIDLDPVLPDRQLYTMAPISPDSAGSGYQGKEFSGVFDGSGKIVSNLTIDGSYYCGMFGRIGTSGSVINLGLENVSVTGSFDNISGLAGESSGNVSNCYITGIVSGRDAVGGLVAENNRGSIDNCYSTCSVTGDYEIGGLVGSNYFGSISNCYSIGIVDGNLLEGGLVGSDLSGIISNCYLYIYCGLNNGHGIPLDDTGLETKSSFSGFDFTGDNADGSGDYWAIEPGYMPRLVWQESPGFNAPYLIDNITTSLLGSGYSDDPFIIDSYSDLMIFKSDSSLRIGYYSLTTDIDLSGITYTEAFIPDDFFGIFQGNGHRISNLTIDSDSNLGLFGRLNGTVDNLILDDISINGTGSYVGGAAGNNYYGIISNCYVTGSIVGLGNYVGGLAGRSYGNISNCCNESNISGSYQSTGGLTGDNSGRVMKSYSTGNVEGRSAVGGLVGNNYGTIVNSYSTGDVSSSNNYVGGLVGTFTSGDMSNCYSTGKVNGLHFIGGLVGDYQPETDNVCNCYFYVHSGPNNGYGMYLDDVGLESKSSFFGFDFTGDDTDGSEDIWEIDPGYMPRLVWQETLGFNAPYLIDNISTSLTGSGYPDAPFIIDNLDDLLEFKNNNALRIGCYSLTSDIDLASVTYTEAFIPDDFFGIFQGNGHRISNLMIDGDSYLGFYSKLCGTVGNLVLENVFINGSDDYVGGLVGDNYYGNIINCNVSGSVSGLDRYVGGLAGDNYYGSISNCYSSSIVTGYRYVGGLVGNNYNGIITKSYNTGTTNGTGYSIGGLTGENYNGSISSSFSTGIVNGESYTGGLCGSNSSGDVSNCYATGDVIGFYSVGGLVGENNYANISYSYSIGAVSGNSVVGGFCGNNISATISSCFWDIETSGRTMSNGSIGKSTAEMQMVSTFTDAGWDFVGEDGNGSEDLWRMPYAMPGYPILAWQKDIAGDIAGGYGVDMEDAALLASGWMENYTKADLETLASNWLAGK